MPMDYSRSLLAAQGYLYLGMFDEAWEELKPIPSHRRNCPEYHHIRIALHLARRRWIEALAVARGLCEHSVESPRPFLGAAVALSQLNRRSEALTIFSASSALLRLPGTKLSTLCSELTFDHPSTREQCLQTALDLRAGLGLPARNSPAAMLSV